MTESGPVIIDYIKQFAVAIFDATIEDSKLDKEEKELGVELFIATALDEKDQ
jgi:hypothetical protein